ncbi:MAG TPA: FG-GAP-like repeat-containing protein [bacterium]|nr:FG-GAP-like repeat-containing protein [bacterium]
MKLTLKTLVAALAFASAGATVQAQTLFQNSNGPCEFEPVICASDACTSFPDALSLACRFINEDETFSGADFNGDGFADCVALRPETSSAPTPNLSVLINRAAGATACEPGPGDQFNTSLDYDLSVLDEDSGNVVAGNLDSGNADIGVASTETDELLQVLNPGAGFGPDGSILVPVGADYALAGRFQEVPNVFSGERNTALFDCNGDDALDAVVLVEDQTPEASPIASARINILRNNGSGLQNLAGAADSVPLNVFWSPAGGGEFLDNATLTIGDFDNDGDLDVAAAIDVHNDSGPTEQVVNVCLNNGSCGFTCDDPPTIDLFAAHPGDNPEPSSVEAGDFNGDNNTDLVVAMPELTLPTPAPQGLQYYFGDGTGNFPNTQFVGYPLAGVLSLDLSALSTGCYNNDNVRDVAVVSTDAESLFNNVGVFTSDGSGGLNSPIALIIGGTFADGIDTADFDQAGGDDIMVLADIPPGPDRNAVIFMNGLETVGAIAGADQTADLNQAVAVSGASCTVTPEITQPFSDPASFEVIWTVNPAAGATLSGADTLTPTFTATAPGAYTLTLSCRTRCTTIVTDTKTVTAGGIPVPTPTPTPTPVLTQGGCLADLSPTAARPSVWAWIGAGLSLGGAWLQGRRRKLKTR